MRTGRIAVAAGAAVSGLAAGYAFVVRPWSRRWGVDPEEATLPLPGDDLVPGASVSETRGIDIDAPPEAVWPWLVQMGFNRAGWYSYDVIDMRGRSVDEIVPDLQRLEVGDTVPTSAETAFEVKVLEPKAALVLYFDDELLAKQMEAARAARSAEGAEEGEAGTGTPANLRAAGAMMPSMPGFRASWAMVLRPRDGGSRLIMRMRFVMAAQGGMKERLGMEAFGFGVFLMTRKQLLGIRGRAERNPGESWESEPLPIG